MPLFGHKNKNHNDTTNDHTGLNTATGAGRHDQMNAAQGINTYPATGVGATGVGAGMHHNPQAGAGTGFANNEQLGTSNLAGQGAYGHGQGMTGHNPMMSNTNDPYAGNGTHAQNLTGGNGLGGGGGRHNNAAGIPPADFVNHNNNASHGSSGAGTRMTGKVESALGSMVGSSALKAKGLQKEQEANAVKAQSSELQEAERLEHEALMRRERAVGHGAHPANAKLGGGI